MRGIVLYSSKTGNTQRMANIIYKHLQDLCEMDIYSVEEKENIDDYDFAIVGGWINRAKLDSRAGKIVKNSRLKNIGLFSTLGANPDSEHGNKCQKNLEDSIKNKNSLGVYQCNGLVEEKLIKNLESGKRFFIPKKIREKMIEASKNSRMATEEELNEAGNFFRENVKKILE